MTVNFTPESANTVTDEATKTSPTAGKLLRQARIKAGVHLAVLSVTLKVPVRQLEALEADDLEPTKGAAFYRGLASGVCRHLNADPADILALLPQISGHLTPLQNDLVGPSSEREVKLDLHASSKGVPGRVFFGSALMLVLTAVLLWMPGYSEWVWVQNIKVLIADEVNSALPSDALEGGQVVDPILMQPSDEVADAIPAIPATPSLPEVSSLPPSTTPASQPLIQSTELTQASTLHQAQSGGPEWIFNATQDSWLELRNEQDELIWSGTVKATESQRIQAALPVRVVVGRAAVVSATFRGKPFDLKPHTRSTVARFEVKE